MDNIDISCYYRLPETIAISLPSNPLFEHLLSVSSGFRTGAQEAIGYHVTKKPTRDYYLHYCLDGTGYFETKNRRHRVEGGDLILCNHNIWHGYGTHHSNPWTTYWVYFDCSYMEQLFPTLSAKSVIQFNIGKNPKILEALNDIVQKMSFGYAVPYLFHATQTLGTLLSDLQLEHGLMASTQKTLEHSVVAYMHQHLNCSLSIKTLADYMGLSNDHFIRTFTAQYGYTPLDYFIRLKMQHACNLLITTNQSIKTLAQTLGYDDAYYFSRAFKKKVGLSPRHYRLAHKAH